MRNMSFWSKFICFNITNTSLLIFFPFILPQWLWINAYILSLWNSIPYDWRKTTKSTDTHTITDGARMRMNMNRIHITHLNPRSVCLVHVHFDGAQSKWLLLILIYIFSWMLFLSFVCILYTKWAIINSKSKNCTAIRISSFGFVLFLHSK